jgi:hypothetical protein
MLFHPERRSLVSLVSVLERNWCYSCGTVETVAVCETVEIANIHAVFGHLLENMVGCSKRLGEYPTLSAIFFNGKKNKGLGAERKFSTKVFYGI